MAKPEYFSEWKTSGAGDLGAVHAIPAYRWPLHWLEEAAQAPFYTDAPNLDQPIDNLFGFKRLMQSRDLLDRDDEAAWTGDLFKNPDWSQLDVGERGELFDIWKEWYTQRATPIPDAGGVDINRVGSLNAIINAEVDQQAVELEKYFDSEIDWASYDKDAKYLAAKDEMLNQLITDPDLRNQIWDETGNIRQEEGTGEWVIANQRWEDYGTEGIRVANQMLINWKRGDQGLIPGWDEDHWEDQMSQGRDRLFQHPGHTLARSVREFGPSYGDRDQEQAEAAGGGVYGLDWSKINNEADFKSQYKFQPPPAQKPTSLNIHRGTDPTTYGADGNPSVSAGTIKGLYRRFFNRDPSATEIADWLGTGKDYDGLVEGMKNHPDSTGDKPWYYHNLDDPMNFGIIKSKYGTKEERMAASKPTLNIRRVEMGPDGVTPKRPVNLSSDYVPRKLYGEADNMYVGTKNWALKMKSTPMVQGEGRPTVDAGGAA